MKFGIHNDCPDPAEAAKAKPEDHGFVWQCCAGIATPRSWQGGSNGCTRTCLATDCHHVLTQSGRAAPGVQAFYERLGFRPGLRVAYVAMRPASASE
jgi:hypothetical protein